MMMSNTINNGQMPLFIQERSPYEFPDLGTQSWIDQIKIRWAAWRKSDAVSSILYDFFANSESPYEAALIAMLNSGDFYTSKQSSLSYHIMEQFIIWKQTFPVQVPPLNIDLKRTAFKLVMKQKNNGLNKLVAKAFEMKNDKDSFIDEIHALVQRKLYKEACQMAIVLELYHHFEIEEFVIPLIFQDKFAIAKDFLDGSQKIQSLTAQYLDNILGEKNTRAEIDRIIRQLDIFDPKKEKLTGKPLSKLLKRIMALYNTPETLCPNLTKKKGSGALQFLIRKRFVEQTIGEESWSEMVEESVGDDFDLQVELVIGVAIFGDRAEAIRWADKYNIPDHLRPYKIQSHRNCDDAGPSENNREEKWPEKKSSTKYHQLKLPESEIHVINNTVDFNNFLEALVKNVVICGIDCEWKPCMRIRKCELALIQIATFEAIYIIDVLNLVPLLPDSSWDTFVDNIFMNTELLKVGFGMDSDFSVMQDTLPCFKGLKPVGPGYVDLRSLWKTLVHKCNFEFPFAGDSESSANSESLNRLIELTLGEKLDKSDQFSNWERRPLRKSQIIYAALDAYCLLEVYEVLRSKAESQNIPFLEIVSDSMGGQMSERKTGKKSKQRSHKRQ